MTVPPDAVAFRSDQHGPTSVHALPDNAPLKEAEAKMFHAVREALANGRMARDAALERLFAQTYGSGGISLADPSAK